MIELAGVIKNFGRLSVLKEVSLSIGEGERVALVGQNGSGKTTLIRCLLGLYQCEGSVEVFGKNPRRSRQEVLAQIGFVPQQSPGIRATVGEFLLATTRLCGIEIEPIATVAENLGLSIPDIQKRAFHALSGGMKQKLLIAVALARRPRLLIMDEPAANLDPLSRAAFFQELDKLDPDTTMLLSSHRIDEISRLVTRLVELDSGRFVVDDIVSVDHGGLGGEFTCEISFREMSPHIRDTLLEWGLQAGSDGSPVSSDSSDEQLLWRGRIPAADQFRFVCVIARWSGLVQSFNLREASND